MKWTECLLLLTVTVMLAGCAVVPIGPSVAVMPGPNKPFEVFQADDAVCRQWARQQIGGESPGQTADRSVAGGATLGALLGAGLGAAIGAATGNVGAGAAIGGATGLVGGAGLGSDAGAYSGYQLQNRYDIAYQQCMYAKGNSLPGVRYRYLVPPPPYERSSAAGG
jgi:hypothetical protein